MTRPHTSGTREKGDGVLVGTRTISIEVVRLKDSVG